uniref:P53 and DNA-damage regulated 1 n=1 Tax=Neogobius melanostomus TaxID=47308 RepID=A0A8C6UF50_9GOBI
MDVDSQRVLEYLTLVEEAAEEVLTTKQQVTNAQYNTRRNCLSEFRNDYNPVKVCFGNIFIKIPANKTTEMIQRDQEQLDKEINDLRKELKAKVNRLNDIQGKPELRGYSLTALSSDELKAINNLLKR